MQLRTDWSISAARDRRALGAVDQRAARAVRAREPGDRRARSLVRRGCTGVDQGGPTLEITGVASVGRQRFTPQLRLNRASAGPRDGELLSRPSPVKVGGEFNHIGFPGRGNALPLHFGGRYIFSADPGPRRRVGSRRPAAGDSRRLRSGLRELRSIPTVGTATSRCSRRTSGGWDVSSSRRACGINGSSGTSPRTDVSDVGGGTFSYPLPSDSNNFAPRLAVAYDLTGDGRTSLHGSYGVFYDNIITAVLDGGTAHHRRAGSASARWSSPRRGRPCAWNAPGHRLTEEQASALLGRLVPERRRSRSIHRSKTPYTHQVSGRRRPRARRRT